MKRPASQAELALRAREILDATFNIDKRNAARVAPAGFRTMRKGWRVTTITKKPGERARHHIVTVHPSEGYSGSFRRCPSVAIDCDCKRYQFVWNYALDQHDAAIKDRTNGEPPVVTNPSEAPGACKHAVIALQYLIRSNPMWTSGPVRINTTTKTIPLTSLHKTMQRVRRGEY